MPLTNAEFAFILEDDSKRIEGDITWCEDEDHSPALEFRAEVFSETGWPLFIRGSYNRLAGALTYAMILKTEGRIYALDLGKDYITLNVRRLERNTSTAGPSSFGIRRPMCRMILPRRSPIPWRFGHSSARRLELTIRANWRSRPQFRRRFFYEHASCL